MQNILVVGGAGYIGGTVTDELIKKKIPFTVYDNLTYEHHYLKPVDFIFGDVRDHKKLQKILPKYTHVILLAAIVGDSACAINPLLTKEVNQDSVAWLANHFDGRIIFTSTCSVYGINHKTVTEEAPTNPLSIYAQTKFAAEQFLRNKNAVIFRLGTAFGIGDTYARIRMDLAVNYMTMNAIKHKKLTIFGGNQWRPFAHVRDIGKVIVASLDKHHTGIFNFASQNAIISEVAEIIQASTGCVVEKVKQKFEDERNYHADSTKGHKAKLFSNQKFLSIADGVEEVKTLVLSNRIKNLELAFYSNEKHLLASIKEYENQTNTFL